MDTLFKHGESLPMFVGGLFLQKNSERNFFSKVFFDPADTLTKSSKREGNLAGYRRGPGGKWQE